MTRSRCPVLVIFLLNGLGVGQPGFSLMKGDNLVGQVRSVEGVSGEEH